MPSSNESGVTANERLTTLTGGLLLVLLALTGITVLSVRRLLPECGYRPTAVHVLGNVSRTGQFAVEELSAFRSRTAITRRSLLVGRLMTGVVLGLVAARAAAASLP